MTAAEKLALPALRRIAELWQAEGPRLHWRPETDSQGFDWWPGDFKVQVRAHTPPSAVAVDTIRLIVTTDFLRDIDPKNSRFEKFAAILPLFQAPTYGWVYPTASLLESSIGSELEAVMWLSSTAYITPENLEWMTDIFAWTSIIQPINAWIQADREGKSLGSGTAAKSHSGNVHNEEPAPILWYMDKVLVPDGKSPSRWAATGEFEKFAEKWARQDSCFGIGDAGGMTLGVPFGSNSANIRFRTNEAHPQLGNGLLVTLQLPNFSDELSTARFVAEQNYLEWMSWTDFPQIGCWHSHDYGSKKTGPAFSLFMPNTLYRGGLIAHIAFWFMSRARWVRKKRFPDLVDLKMIEILERRPEEGEDTSL